MNANNPLHVAVGIIKNPAGEVLISYRDESAHQGGLWEFPGGKFEPGETPNQALQRELREELNITVENAMPAIKIHHQYPDKAVLLDVWSVDGYSGEPAACEGQPLKWVLPNDLTRYSFPDANRPIINVARLPDCYAILDGDNSGKLEADLRHILNNGIRLVQIRAKSLAAEALIKFYRLADALCKQHGAELLVNSYHQYDELSFEAGIHLTGRHLLKLNEKPECNGWVAASCHNVDELKHAEKIGVDFAVLAPVVKTATHPDAGPLGWDVFEEWVSRINVPVFALGGMKRNDVARAKKSGGQGIAGISAFL